MFSLLRKKTHHIRPYGSRCFSKTIHLFIKSVLLLLYMIFHSWKSLLSKMCFLLLPYSLLPFRTPSTSTGPLLWSPNFFSHIDSCLCLPSARMILKSLNVTMQFSWVNSQWLHHEICSTCYQNPIKI